MKRLNAIIVFALLSALFIAIRSSSVNAQETLMWSANISSSGVPVTSPTLKSGYQYRIEAQEVFWYDYPAYLVADAQYYTTETSGWMWTNYFPEPNGHSFLQIDGQDVNWGPFSNGNTGHTYNTYITGNGAAITFRIVDWIDGNYNNNECHLPVYIYESPPLGRSPGYWKHQFKAYYDDKGSPQETWADLEFFTGKINAYYGIASPYFDGYPLPPVSSLDHDLDGTFEMDDAYYVFKNSNHNTLWLGLANWYNWASGRGPYY